MTVHPLFLNLSITASDCEQAALERLKLTPGANPLGVALARQTYFKLTHFANYQLTVIDRRAGETFRAEIPFDLAEFLLRFEQGAPFVHNRDVSLALWRDGE